MAKIGYLGKRSGKSRALLYRQDAKAQGSPWRHLCLSALAVTHYYFPEFDFGWTSFISFTRCPAPAYLSMINSTYRISTMIFRQMEGS